MQYRREVLRALVEFADTLTADHDTAEFLHRLTVRCVALLEVDEAGILIVDPSGTGRHVASSSEQMHVIELVQLQDNEGPCLEAHRSARVTVSSDGHDAEQAWPRFGSQARAAGFESFAGIPMRLRDESIGALNLFRRHPGEFSPEALYVGQALADVATIGMLQARALADAHVVTAQLQTALHSRIAIEQAKGVVAEHMTISVDEAFKRLRAHARSHNQQLTDVARSVVDRSLKPEMLTAGQRTRTR